MNEEICWNEIRRKLIIHWNEIKKEMFNDEICVKENWEYKIWLNEIIMKLWMKKCFNEIGRKLRMKKWK